MTLIDALGIHAMKMDKKLLSIIGDVQVCPFSEIYDLDNTENVIAVGKNVGLSDIYRCSDNHGLNYLVQQQHDHFIYNLIMSAIINKFPDSFLKKPLPTILRSTDHFANNSIEVPFTSSDQKNEVMSKVVSFLDANERLSSIKGNVMLIANELMMNALYCAPTDSAGNPIYLNHSRLNPVQYESGQMAEVTLSHNQDVLVVGCRDPFGSVNKKKVVSRLNQVFQPDQKAKVAQASDNTGGSGLGLKMVIEASTGFGMLVKKGSETFVYATLPLGRGNKSIARMAKNLCLNFYS